MEFVDAIIDASIDHKPYLALGAWGGRTTSITATLPDALALGAYIEQIEREFNRHDHGPDELPFLHSETFGPREYYSQVSKYKFLVAPRGVGIQSPKFLEALMTYTIPVTKRYGAFDDLKDRGFPIVLVKKWSDITEEMLNNVSARSTVAAT